MIQQSATELPETFMVINDLKYKPELRKDQYLCANCHQP